MNEIKNKKTTSTKRQQIKRNWFNWSEFIFSSPLPVRNKIAKHVCVCVCWLFFFVCINLISRFVWFLFFCGEGGDEGFIIMKMIQNSQWSDWLIFFSQAKLFALPLISKFFSFVSPLIQLVCYFFFAICSIYCDHYTFVYLNGILLDLISISLCFYLFCFFFVCYWLLFMHWYQTFLFISSFIQERNFKMKKNYWNARERAMMLLDILYRKKNKFIRKKRDLLVWITVAVLYKNRLFFKWKFYSPFIHYHMCVIFFACEFVFIFLCDWINQLKTNNDNDNSDNNDSDKNEIHS